MTDNPHPTTDTLVELAASEQHPLNGVRVVAADAAVLTLSLPLSDVPVPGTAVTVRWPAGPRGRYALATTVTAVDENRVELRATAAPVIEQHRNFVRGGGGEHVLLCRPGQEDLPGHIRDISEQGVRAYFADVDLHPGDEIRLRIQLGTDVVEASAVVTKVATMRQSVPEPGPMSVEAVAVLSCHETQAKMIRRYVLRQQMLTRVRTG
ncbi:MAG TPA: PilZ domain-containing protein [Actinoplanes sp.]|nr:PilZ domain-containing protein [Actinoplanes sp.]